ncbi:MAG TPA: hypothetical protein VNX46_00180 [Candidatus Acidoferrum sp.]|nr:hypothetical protein [Candidatus Acidoferrum sp.]
MANYIIIGGDQKEYGPISADDVCQWVKEGRLNGQSLAKAVSDAEYRPLEKFPEFADLFRGASPGVSAPPPLTSDEWVAQVTTGQPELRLGECLGAGWSFLAANVGFLAGAVILTSIVNMVFALGGQVVPLIGPLAAVAFNAVIMGGFYLACLRRLRGETVAPTAVFSGFQTDFVQLFLTGLVSGSLIGLSACCLLLPAIYLTVAWTFAILLVADRKMFFWTAMEVSRKVVTKVWFEAFALLFVALLPMVIFQVCNLIMGVHYFLGLYDQANHNMQQMAPLLQSQNGEFHKLALEMVLIGQIVLLVNLFYLAGVIVRAYENLFGEKKS